MRYKLWGPHITKGREKDGRRKQNHLAPSRVSETPTCTGLDFQSHAAGMACGITCLCRSFPRLTVFTSKHFRSLILQSPKQSGSEQSAHMIPAQQTYFCDVGKCVPRAWKRDKKGCGYSCLVLFNKLSWARSAGIQHLDSLSHRQQWSVYGKSHCLKQSALFAHRYITVEILVTSTGPLLSSPSWPPFWLVTLPSWRFSARKKSGPTVECSTRVSLMVAGLSNRAQIIHVQGPGSPAKIENMQGQSTDYTCAGLRQPSIDWEHAGPEHRLYMCRAQAHSIDWEHAGPWQQSRHYTFYAGSDLAMGISCCIQLIPD